MTVVREDDGRLGTVCIYQAKDKAAIREHARRVGMSAEDIVVVEDTVIVREDPKYDQNHPPQRIPELRASPRKKLR